MLDLERVTSERDQYLGVPRRLQAEFEDYKKQVSKLETQAQERANDSLTGENCFQTEGGVNEGPCSTQSVFQTEFGVIVAPLATFYDIVAPPTKIYDGPCPYVSGGGGTQCV